MQRAGKLPAVRMGTGFGMTTAARILLVEDDPTVRESVCDLLSSRKHEVVPTQFATEGIRLLRSETFDVVILDWELPDGTGIDICHQYRAAGGTSPVLMLTGRSSIDDKEAGFDGGADDYLCKPFSINELAARVEALCRRPKSYNHESDKIRLLLDVSTFVWGEHRVELPAKELALLDFLMRHQDRHFSAGELLDKVWSDSSDTTEEGLRACMRRLRCHLTFPGKEDLIQSSRGYGYRFCSPSDD